VSRQRGSSIWLSRSFSSFWSAGATAFIMAVFINEKELGGRTGV